MLSGGGPNIGRTEVGVRALNAGAPAFTQKAKKKGVDGDGKLDRLSRDERGRAIEALLEGEEEDEGGLEQPSGHGDALRRVEGDAFRSDDKGARIAPAFSDIDQGNLGDAWLLATCAAIAHAQPRRLLERITRNEDGTFQVRLEADRITISPDFPSERYADPTPNGQRDTLWVALVEKAFALREASSYSNLELGNPSRALEALTGRLAKRISLSTRSDLDRLWARLSEAKSRSQPMVMRTPNRDVAQPLQADHAYAVLDVFEAAKSKERMLKLYNPWGTKNNSRSLESMIHTIRLDVLRFDCEAIHLGGA
jgi:hypothetical protein